MAGGSLRCCFTCTETTGTVGDGEPRTATLTFTQLLSSLVVGGVEGVVVLKMSSGKGMHWD